MRRTVIVSFMVLLAVALLVQCGRDFTRYPSGSGASVSLTSVEPTSGANDQEISIALRGTNFRGSPRILLGAVDCTNIQIVSDKLLTAVIPADTAANVYDITYLTEALESVVLPDAFTVVDPGDISILSIDPNVGLDNDTTAVTITGTNFLDGATVAIGAATLESVTVSSVTTINATVPSGLTPGVYDVVVTNSSGGSATLVEGFTVLSSAQLQITGINPDHGSTDVDVDVAITGANFDDAMTVLIGYTLADDVERITSDLLYATVPAGITPGVYSVRVINSDDEYAELTDAYTVDAAGDDDTSDDDTSDDDTTDDDTTDDDTTDDDTTDDDTTDDDTV